MHCGDTSFFVDLFDPDRKLHEAAKDWYDSHGERPLFAPAVVNWELYRGAVRVGDDYVLRIQRFLEDVESIPLTAERALEAAHVEQETGDEGAQLATADCLIAGTVRAVGGTLVTRDSDFDRVAGLPTDVYIDRN